MKNRGLQRVAIVDFDVHFGNGTFEIFEKDANVFFSSVHLSSRVNNPFFASDLRGATLIDEENSNCCVAITRRSGEFRKTFRDQILPRLKLFDPELVMLSAGFDGHRDDPLGGDLGLHEEDYRWLTAEITKVCDNPYSSCQGRICSVLEGGYDISEQTNALAKSVVAHVEILSQVPEEDTVLPEDVR